MTIRSTHRPAWSASLTEETARVIAERTGTAVNALDAAKDRARAGSTPPAIKPLLEEADELRARLDDLRIRALHVARGR